MKFDSSIFDLRRYESGVINKHTPLEIGNKLLEQLIEVLPEDETILESCMRSIVNILIISKLQSNQDRSELDYAKYLLSAGQSKIISAKPINRGDVQVINLDRWSIITLKQSANYSPLSLCNSISRIVDDAEHSPHIIFDLSGCNHLDLNLTAYLIGLRDMLQRNQRKMSIVWLPRTAVSPTLLHTLTARFNLFKKGAFLLSSAPEMAA